MSRLSLIVLERELAVVRLMPRDTLPAWFDWAASPIASATRTNDEVSLLYPADLVPQEARAERGWRAIKVQGILDFSLTGILASLLAPLAAAAVSVFALSTYDTDYVLVRVADLPRALAALRDDFDVAADSGDDAAAAPNGTVRRARPEDAARVRDLVRAAYTKWVAVIGREPKPMQADYDLAVREHLVDLLLVDGALVGVIEMIPADDHLLIENVAIVPEWHGRGHGRRLMAHAEAVAASLGRSEIRLYTNKRFAANLVLYARLGYAVTSEAEFPGGIVVHMAKRIGDLTAHK